MFDLNSGVNFDEIILIGFRVEKKFYGTGIIIIYGFAYFYGCITDALSEAFFKILRRGNLNDFLVPPLKRAVAFKQMYNIMVLVAEDLHLNVACLFDIFFYEALVRTEGRQRFTLRLVQAMSQFQLTANHTHTAAAAAMSGLDDNRISQFAAKRPGLIQTFHGVIRSGEYWNLRFSGNLSGGGFITKHLENFRTRTDEGNACLFTGVRKSGILREKPITTMYGVNLLLFGQLNDSVDVQIGLNRFFALTDLIRLVCFKFMKSKAIFVGINCHGINAKFMRCPADPYRYFTTVGNEKLFKFPDFHKKPLSRVS